MTRQNQNPRSLSISTTSKDLSCNSISSGFGDESNSTSDSTDSVIFQPLMTSCDEMADSDSNATKNHSKPPPPSSDNLAKKTTDHIASLRESRMKSGQPPPPKRDANRKMETTFDSEVHTEEKVVADNVESKVSQI